MTPSETITIVEHELDDKDTEALQELLGECFPAFLSDRIFYKQLPDFRVLRRQGGQLVGQVGVDHRMIRVGQTPLEIFGVVDLCVAPDFRSCGHGEELLRAVERKAVAHDIDGIMLFADDHRLYDRCQYEQIERKVTWLGIDEFESLGVLVDTLSGCMMVKPLTVAGWPAGDIDMMGYLF